MEWMFPVRSAHPRHLALLYLQRSICLFYPCNPRQTLGQYRTPFFYTTEDGFPDGSVARLVRGRPCFLEVEAPCVEPPSPPKSAITPGQVLSPSTLSGGFTFFEWVPIPRLLVGYLPDDSQPLLFPNAFPPEPSRIFLLNPRLE